MELLQRAPPDDLRALVNAEVAAVVKRDRRNLGRPALFYVVEGCLAFSVASGVYVLVVLGSGIIAAIRRRDPYAAGSSMWGASLFMAVFFLLAWRMMDRKPKPATATAADAEQD
jgi:hypothetical protein